MKSNRTTERLILACLRAVAKHGLGAYGLMELETYHGGPGCGAAGGVVRKWPSEGIVSSGYRFKAVRGHLRTKILVEKIADLTRYLTPDEKASLVDFPKLRPLALPALRAAGFVTADNGLTDLGVAVRDELAGAGR